MWENMSEPDMSQMVMQYDAEKIWLKYEVTKARMQAHTLSILIITGFPQQQLFDDGSSKLRYTHIAWL